MTQRVPSWDLEDVNPNHHIYKLDYEVAELTWENGQLSLHELGSRRVPSKSQPTTTWDPPRAAETLEAVVNQATLHHYSKTEAPVTNNNDDLVPRMHHHNPTVTAGNINQSTTVTSDALVPNANNRNGGDHVVCSTRVSSCSGNPSGFMEPRVARGGGDTTYTDDLGGQRLTCTSTGSPENPSSGRDFSNSTFPDRTASHRRAQRETKTVNEKSKSSMVNKRRRTAATHNQSERKRRDKINQKLKTLQKLVPNSSKTDKASMLDEVIEHIKQLQVQLHTVNIMNMSPMMMSLMMQQQQQLQLQKSMMNTMGMGLGMGMGMGMGGMDMNTIGASNIPTRFHPSAFMQMPTNTPASGPMPPFLASRSAPLNMDSYSRMAALYQQMQNQPCGPFPKN